MPSALDQALWLVMPPPDEPFSLYSSPMSETTRLRPPYGISNFAQLRQGGYLYVDKTRLEDQKCLFMPRTEDSQGVFSQRC
jgi:hypothetical protein